MLWKDKTCDESSSLPLIWVLLPLALFLFRCLPIYEYSEWLSLNTYIATGGHLENKVMNLIFHQSNLKTKAPSTLGKVWPVTNSKQTLATFRSLRFLCNSYPNRDYRMGGWLIRACLPRICGLHTCRLAANWRLGQRVRWNADHFRTTARTELLLLAMSTTSSHSAYNGIILCKIYCG